MIKLLNDLLIFLNEHYKNSFINLNNGIILLENISKEKKLFISIDVSVIGDCKYAWHISYSNGVKTGLTHSNFSHLTNTIIKIFME